METSTADDQARRAFLSDLLARVGDDAGLLQVEYSVIAPFRGLSAKVSSPDKTSVLILTPVSMRNGAKTFDSFPGPGTPYVDLYVTRGRGADWLTGLAGHICTDEIEHLVTAIRSWRDATLVSEPLAAPPLTARDLQPLRALAAARQALAEAAASIPDSATMRERSEALGLADGLQTASQTPLSLQEQARLATDLIQLDPLRLMSNAPRDAQGRLALGATMLLAPYETSDPPQSPYQRWLVARTPARRRDPQVITLTLQTVIPENHSLRWDSARWLWDRRAADASEVTRWGVTGLRVDELGLEGREHRIAALESCGGSTPNDLRDRVTLCILLQDAGRVEEAVALHGVQLAPEVSDIVRGGMRSLGASNVGSDWARFLQEQLRAMAPWRFSAVLTAETERLRTWVAAKRGRTFRAPRLRLIALPHQTRQSKASLILVGIGPNHDVPRLEIEYTASNIRLPEPLWQRPVELDLARFGLL